jgi:hypothetical protein
MWLKNFLLLKVKFIFFKHKYRRKCTFTYTVSVQYCRSKRVLLLLCILYFLLPKMTKPKPVSGRRELGLKLIGSSAPILLPRCCHALQQLLDYLPYFNYIWRMFHILNSCIELNPNNEKYGNYDINNMVTYLICLISDLKGYKKNPAYHI